MNNSFSETFITSFDHEISVDVVYQPSHISDCHLIRVADALLYNLSCTNVANCMRGINKALLKAVI